MFNLSFPNIPLSSLIVLSFCPSTCPILYTSPIVCIPPTPPLCLLCPLVNLPPHQYRSDNKSPVSQRVRHIVILLSIGFCQVHPSVRVPHSNLKRQRGLQLYGTTFPPLIIHN